jgi:hypothetical protein
MWTHLLALTLVVCDPQSVQARPEPSRGPGRLSASGGIRTDRLSHKKLKIWNSVVAIVMAKDAAGHSLYPTLRSLWDSVDTSGHAVYVEMHDAGPRPSFIAGRFAITRVDPEGKAHEGVLILNPSAIDNLSTGPAARRANGFIPFEGLGRTERYAELLGHELAHAVWSLADTERARLAQWFQAETKRQAQIVLAARARGVPAGIDRDLAELDRIRRMLEEPAEAAEAAIWRELRAGRRR